MRNGSLLNALASVLVPSARLEKPYLRPQSVDECEINLSVALQTLQSASLLDKDLDIQAIAFAMGTYRFRCRNQGSLSLTHTHTLTLSHINAQRTEMEMYSGPATGETEWHLSS